MLDGSVSGEHARIVNRAYGFEIEDQLDERHLRPRRTGQQGHATKRRSAHHRRRRAPLPSGTADSCDRPAAQPDGKSGIGAREFDQRAGRDGDAAVSAAVVGAGTAPPRDDEDLTLADLAQKVLKSPPSSASDFF